MRTGPLLHRQNAAAAAACRRRSPHTAPPHTAAPLLCLAPLPPQPDQHSHRRIAMPAAAAAALGGAPGSSAAAAAATAAAGAGAASALFLLEAKSFAEEDRSAAARTVHYWLKPGAYGVGKPKHAELAIDEDKSISRRHADLQVPPADAREPGAPPYVLLTGGCWRLAVESLDACGRRPDTRRAGGWPGRGRHSGRCVRAAEPPLHFAALATQPPSTHPSPSPLPSLLRPLSHQTVPSTAPCCPAPAPSPTRSACRAAARRRACPAAACCASASSRPSSCTTRWGAGRVPESRAAGWAVWPRAAAKLDRQVGAAAEPHWVVQWVVRWLQAAPRAVSAELAGATCYPRPSAVPPAAFSSPAPATRTGPCT